MATGVRKMSAQEWLAWWRNSALELHASDIVKNRPSWQLLLAMTEPKAYDRREELAKSWLSLGHDALMAVLVPFWTQLIDGSFTNLSATKEQASWARPLKGETLVGRCWDAVRFFATLNSQEDQELVAKFQALVASGIGASTDPQYVVAARSVSDVLTLWWQSQLAGIDEDEFWAWWLQGTAEQKLQEAKASPPDEEEPPTPILVKTEEEEPIKEEEKEAPPPLARSGPSFTVRAIGAAISAGKGLADMMRSKTATENTPPPSCSDNSFVILVFLLAGADG